MSERSESPQPDFADLSARVYRLCLGLLRSEADARDAAQESLARGWAKRHRKRRDVSWWVWVGGFAVRVCREMRRGRAGLAPGPLLDSPSRLGPIEARLVEPGHVALHDAIMDLPNRQREVTVLRFLLGQSTQQTASLLGCPTGTVKSNLHKALANLRATLRDAELPDALHRV